MRHEAAMDRQHCWRLGSGDAERDVLFDVVPQHEACHFIGHLRQQPTAILVSERAREHAAVEQDLDVDLVVGGIYSGGIVDRVSVDPTPNTVSPDLGVFDPAELTQAQVATLPDDPSAYLRAVQPDRIIGFVPDVGIVFRSCLDIRANAAVPQQVDGCGQDAADQLGWGERLDVISQP
jgi:hypothetical protein